MVLGEEKNKTEEWCEREESAAEHQQGQVRTEPGRGAGWGRDKPFTPSPHVLFPLGRQRA